MQEASPGEEPVAHYVRTTSLGASEEPARLRIHQRKPWRRWLFSGVIIVIAAALAVSILMNDNLGWPVVMDYLFSSVILKGLLATIELSVIAMVIGLVLGVAFALAGRSRLWALRRVAGFYIWLFRGVPLLVQLLFWFNVGILVPGVTLFVPFTDLSHYISANALISGFTASILGLGLNEGAYMAEIVRAGIISVPKGQMDAALSIGLPPSKAMRSLILPQTIRVIIPPAGNEFIGLVKSSALVAVIGGGDLLYQAQIIYGQNFEVIPLLLVVSIWYLIITTVATGGQALLERHLSTEFTKATNLSDAGSLRRWTLSKGAR